MNKTIMNRTVVAIPPSYKLNEELEIGSTIKYLKYLKKNNVNTVMTTEGTSNFNLMSNEEIHTFNKTIVKHFNGHKIIGVPSLSLRDAKKFIMTANNYADSKTNLMVLFPDRFYNKNCIYRYISNLREVANRDLYVHSKPLRNAVGGVWDYTSDLLNQLKKNRVILGIKEEHSDLIKSYDFICELDKDLDVIVAGGSMRRYEFLKSAGANSFLSGVGNLFPKVEQSYIDGNRELPLEIEKMMFKVFMKFGWHKSLRIALRNMKLTCLSDRRPWPLTTFEEKNKIIEVIERIKNEQQNLDSWAV